jgi:hypothetical protein
MNDTLFIFGVIPATICFVGFVFTLFFGPDILRWYNEQRALQRKTRVPSAPPEPIENAEEPHGSEPVSSKREKELVHS